MPRRGPHPSFVDMTGQVRGHWTVLRRTPNSAAGAEWECCCACGALKVIRGIALRRDIPPCRVCGRRGWRRLPRGGARPAESERETPRQFGGDPEPIVLAARCTVCQSRHGCSGGACIVCGSSAVEFLPHVDGRAA